MILSVKMAYKESLLLFVLFLVLSQAAVYKRTVRYDDEILVRCPTKVAGMKSFLESDNVDVWQIYSDGMADVRINKDLLETTTHAVANRECTKIANVEQLVQQAENMTFHRKPGKAEWFEEYHQYDEIVKWYMELCEENSNICKFVSSIGKSSEGRDQPAVHIRGQTDPSGFKIYFQCQIHAREWISGATCMYIANYLVKSYSDNSRVKEILDNVEFIFVPFVNPDGYEYTWSNDRMWRKNRRINSGSSCRGVDLNRNYPDHWNEGGSSSNPCSETYHGPSAESEPETQNTVNYFKENTPIIGAIDWHSYSQLILRPYGWTSSDSPDETQLRELGDRMHDAIFEVDDKRYTSMKSIGLYPTSGTASDWFYGEDATDANKGYRAAGYTIELRDTGSYGFLLPPEQIIPTGEENVAGVLVFAEELKENPLIVKNKN